MEITDIKGLERNIKEGMDCLLRVSSEKDLLSSIIETTSIKHNIDKSEVRRLIAIAYKKAYDFEKYDKEKNTIESVFNIIDSMNI